MELRQKSLQPLIRRYREKFSSGPAARIIVDGLMPEYGKRIFSEGCLRATISADCKSAILAAKKGAAQKAALDLAIESLQSAGMPQEEVVKTLVTF